MSWIYTQSKKVLESMFEQKDFGKSSKYKIQSPFNPAKSFPQISTWELWYNTFNNFNYTFDRNSKICVMFNIEAVLLLIEDFGVRPDQITLISDDSNKSALAKSWGVNVKLQEEKDMKFTHVIKNPPWDKAVYVSFWNVAEELLLDEGYQIDILPTNWMTLPSFQVDRNNLLSKFKICSITILDNSKGQVFEAQPGGDVVIMISQKISHADNTSVVWKYMDNAPFTVDLTKHPIWPMYQTSIGADIFDKIIAKKKNDMRHVDECSGDKDRTDPNIAKYIPQHFISSPTKVHSRKTYGFMNKDGSKWHKDELKGIADEHIYEFDSSSIDLHYQWIQTDMFAYALEMVKSTGKNQPGPTKFLGEHSFSNNNFAKHFGLSQTHLDDITRWTNQK